MGGVVIPIWTGKDVGGSKLGLADWGSREPID